MREGLQSGLGHIEGSGFVVMSKMESRRLIGKHGFFIVTGKPEVLYWRGCNGVIHRVLLPVCAYY